MEGFEVQNCLDSFRILVDTAEQPTEEYQKRCDSRKELEEYFNKRIFLELFVSVKEDWLNNPRILKELGYK